MATHILLMNVLAPLAILTLRPVLSGRTYLTNRRTIFPATILQLVLLWVWHSPPLLELSLHEPVAMLAMSGALLAAALWFWQAVFAASDAHRWQSIFALLVTAKIFCLLGVLLVFAPRPLYASLDLLPAQDPSSALADQHLAGLLMVTACPLTYLTAGVLIATRWIVDMDGETSKLLHGPRDKMPIK